MRLLIKGIGQTFDLKYIGSNLNWGRPANRAGGAMIILRDDMSTSAVLQHCQYFCPNEQYYTKGTPYTVPKEQ